jgi:hypothetical protein
MTWLKGTSTLAAIGPLIAQLVCGEVADGSSVTCAVGDRWVRENVGRDTIRTPTSVDYTPAVWQARAGYFSLQQVPNQIGNQGKPAPGRNLDGSAGSASVAQVTGPFTSNPTTLFNRWNVQLQVATANTVAGNYTTARITYSLNDLDRITTGNISSGTLTPSASGVVTLPNGATVQVTDPSGILTVGTMWQRSFTSTYTYGIDYWPWWARRGSGVAAPTWTTAPPGVAGTDYDIIDQVTPLYASNFPFNGMLGMEASLSGLGIKTATGLGASPMYSGTFPIALAKCRIYANGTNGQYAIDPGPSVLDSVNGSVLRPSGCIANGITPALGNNNTVGWPEPFLRCITTPGSATGSTAVQYFISCKATGIFIVLNGDPAGTGIISTGYIGTFTPNDVTNDVLPVMWSQLHNSPIAAAYYQPFMFSMPYWFLRRQVDPKEVAVHAGTATSTTATTLADTGATRTVNQDVGLTIYAGSSSGVVTSNTATTWTVTSWTGGTPSGTATYRVQRDWQTGFMRNDFGASIPYGISGGTNGSGGVNQYTMITPGWAQSSPTGTGAANEISYPASGQKPMLNDGNWWLWGWNYVDSGYGMLVGSGGSTMDDGLNAVETAFFRGSQNLRFFYLPGVGWGHGDELTDTGSGEKFLLIAPGGGTPTPCLGAGAQYSLGGASYTGGIAVAEL